VKRSKHLVPSLRLCIVRILNQSGQSFPQDFKTLVRVSTAGEAAITIFHVGQRPKSIVQISNRARQKPLGFR